METMMHLANEDTVAKLNAAIEFAVVEAQRNAARAIIVRDQSLSEEELAAYDAKTKNPDLEGPDPSDEEIERIKLAIRARKGHAAPADFTGTD
jgi:N-methylhydantoinase B/oxoprolinase/acetone carboxylase alpha subunit